MRNGRYDSSVRIQLYRVVFSRGMGGDAQCIDPTRRGALSATTTTETLAAVAHALHGASVRPGRGMVQLHPRCTPVYIDGGLWNFSCKARMAPVHARRVLAVHCRSFLEL